jgi:hypothetical protein
MSICSYRKLDAFIDEVDAQKCIKPKIEEAEELMEPAINYM